MLIIQNHFVYKTIYLLSFLFFIYLNLIFFIVKLEKGNLPSTQFLLHFHLNNFAHQVERGPRGGVASLPS